jgi:hypothetical protein
MRVSAPPQPKTHEREADKRSVWAGLLIFIARAIAVAKVCGYLGLRCANPRWRDATAVDAWALVARDTDERLPGILVAWSFSTLSVLNGRACADVVARTDVSVPGWAVAVELGIF